MPWATRGGGGPPVGPLETLPGVPTLPPRTRLTAPGPADESLLFDLLFDGISVSSLRVGRLRGEMERERWRPIAPTGWYVRTLDPLVTVRALPLLFST